MATETLEAPPAKVEAPTMTARERVIAMENQVEAENKARLDSEVSRLNIQDLTDEPLPQGTEAPPEAAAPAAAPVEDNEEVLETEAEIEAIPRNDKGQFIIRPTRYKALRTDRIELRSLGATKEERAQLKADRAELLAIKAELARFQLDGLKAPDANGKVNGDGKAVQLTPIQQAEAKIVEAEKAIEEADLEFDKAAEEFADAATMSPIRAKQRAAIRALAQAEADLRIISARGQDSNKQAFQSWEAEVRKADLEHKELRDTLFKQDQERFPDLKNEKSQLYHVTESILAHWFKTGDKDLTAPDAQRLAAEKAARHLGIKIPPIAGEAAVKPSNGSAPKAEVTSASNGAAALQTRGSVIAGANRAPAATGNAVEVFGKMTQAQRRDFLIKMDSRQ